MQRVLFLIFFIAVLSVLFFANRYVVMRGAWALENTSFQQVFKIAFWVLPAMFILGQVLERLQPMGLTRVVTTIGGVWLGWFWYAFLVTVLVGLIKLLGQSLGWHWLTSMNKLTVFAVVFFGLLALVVYGIVNASSPVVKQYDLKLSKPLVKPIKIAMISDIHIGAVRTKKNIEKLVEMINSQQPDVVLIAGDLVDHNPRFGIKAGVGEAFDKLNVPMGVFASTGNHEYLGHAEMSIDYLSKHDIRYLRDEYLVVDNQLVIAGREDREMEQLSGKQRLSTAQILETSDKQLPVILMDHQPVEYDKAIVEGVDVMVSGHTHKGQLWPFNYATNLVFENHYGLMQKANTWFYTSNGYGTWGPPMRIGNKPEVAILNLTSE